MHASAVLPALLRRPVVLTAVVAQAHVAVVRMLIDRVQSIDVQDLRGRTALMHAAIFGHVDSVKVLLDAGADVSQPANRSALLHLIWPDTAAAVNRV